MAALARDLIGLSSDGSCNRQAAASEKQTRQRSCTVAGTHRNDRRQGRVGAAPMAVCGNATAWAAVSCTRLSPPMQPSQPALSSAREG